MHSFPVTAALAVCLAASVMTAQAPVAGEAPDTLRTQIAGEERVSNTAPMAGDWTVPAIARITMGNSNNYFPHGRANMRHQQVFIAAEMTKPGRWVGHANRNGMMTTGRPGGTTTLTIKLGRTSYDETNITSTFATNATGTQTTVANALKIAIPDLAGRNFDTTLFQVQYPYTTPYIYTGSAGGNILLEVVNTSTANILSYLDAIGSDPKVTTTRIYATTATAATGTITRNYGVVHCFLDRVKSQGQYEVFGKPCPGTGGKTGVILPAAMRTIMGNSNNIFGHSYFNQRYQQTFLGSEMGTARRFTGHAFRRDQTATTNGGTITIEVLMGLTTYTHTTMTTTYATNATGTQTTVLPQSKVSVPTIAALNTDPKDFKIRIAWKNPWIWTAASGQNVLFENRNYDTTTGATSYYDAHSGTTTSRLYATGTSAATGTKTTNYGLVMCFTYSGQGSNPPTIGSTGRPILGKSFDVTLTDAKANAPAILMMGFSDTKWGAITLPFNLAALGAPACSLNISFDLVFGVVVADSQGVATFTHVIPNNTALNNAVWFNQIFVVDQAANTLGLAFSAGAKAKVGEQ